MQMASIRLLPMNPLEFDKKSTVEVQQDFFLGSLPAERQGAFLFRTRGLKADPGTIVLFQYRNHVIASGIFDHQEWFPTADNGYRGALHFVPSSIDVFEPIGPDVMRQVWPQEFEEFSRAKQTLSAEPYLALTACMENRRTTIDRAPKACDIAEPDTRRAYATVLRIIRDSGKSIFVKHLHNYECQIVGCGQFIEYGNGLRYAEGHHIKPLGRPHGGPDKVENILCLCPNHHAACDLGVLPIELRNLKQVPGHHVDKTYVDYHNEHIYGQTTTEA